MAIKNFLHLSGALQNSRIVRGENEGKNKEEKMKLKEKLQDTWLSSPDIPENWSALKPHLEAEIIRESIEKTYLDAETEVLHLSDGYKYFSSGPSWGIDPV